MTDDTISRQAAIEICDWYEHEFPECEYMVRLMAKDLQDIPSAERRGRWILRYGDGHIETSIVGGECSLCGFVAPATRYCPYCGARMVEE